MSLTKGCVREDAYTGGAKTLNSVDIMESLGLVPGQRLSNMVVMTVWGWRPSVAPPSSWCRALSHRLTQWHTQSPMRDRGWRRGQGSRTSGSLVNSSVAPALQFAMAAFEHRVLSGLGHTYSPGCAGTRSQSTGSVCHYCYCTRNIHYLFLRRHRALYV